MTVTGDIVAPRGPSRAALLWVILLSLADSVGFYLNLQLLMKFGNPILLWVLVLACSGAAVLLPLVFGHCLSQRRSGEADTAPLLWVTALLWFALGITMFVTRVTSPAITQERQSIASNNNLLPGRGTPDSSAESWIVATLFCIIFCATALIAARHSYQVNEGATFRTLYKTRSQLIEELTQHRHARDHEEQLRRAAQEQQDLITRGEGLGMEAAQALANLENEEKVEACIEEMGDPASTEIFLTVYEEQSDRRSRRAGNSNPRPEAGL